MTLTRVLADSVTILGYDAPLEPAKFWVSVLGFVGTVAALSFAAWQYRRADKWRRAEFVEPEQERIHCISTNVGDSVRAEVSKHGRRGTVLPSIPQGLPAVVPQVNGNLPLGGTRNH